MPPLTELWIRAILHKDSFINHFFWRKAVNKKKFYPVIECGERDGLKERSYAASNVSTALHNGADGVFLVGPCPHLAATYLHVRQQFPDAWIGLRFQGTCPNTETVRLLGAVRKAVGLNALWTDKLPGSRLDVPVPVFGSLSLNYCKEESAAREFEEICLRAARTVDVATVFGPEKGSPPSMTMVGGVRNLFERFRQEHDSNIEIAVAGGVYEDNLFKFIRSADIFVVATHISEEGLHGRTHLIPEKVARLSERIHG